jgi:N-acetylglucosaminyldiphosphoundecaprenol N-acetyl-beta-D-mannosaminyltransferase
MDERLSVPLSSRKILGMRVDVTSYSDATYRIMEWAKKNQQGYVCAANVHMVMESYDSEYFREIVNGAELVTPDGKPMVWGLHLLGMKRATRVYGPDLTGYVLEAAVRENIPMGLYGGSKEVLNNLVGIVEKRYPGVSIVYSHSPPFRLLKPEEDERIIADIDASGARILLIGLGCPKQEMWMAEHYRRINAVMLGVGAAFDFFAGSKAQAPRWMMGMGLEWLFRLVTEPRRLWRRYCIQNPRFIFFFGLQLLRYVRFLKASP